MLTREQEKLTRALGGIKDMGGTPDLIFVIDTNKEQLAIQEARRLNIPVVAIVDTNCDPDGVTFPVPANDDAGRAIQLYCDLVSRAAIDGISRSQSSLGVDVGASVNPMAEALPVAPSSEGFQRLAAPQGAPDDLSKLGGVGPQLATKLNEYGIFHFWQLAAMSEADVAALDAELKLNGRAARDGWLDTARALAA
ncbi:MAG: 30S ribosomal protein S2, partial [Methylobacterium sp.]|nr:30S ribosomal protein S2 [Methylobacterium sp.]